MYKKNFHKKTSQEDGLVPLSGRPGRMVRDPTKSADVGNVLESTCMSVCSHCTVGKGIPIFQSISRDIESLNA